jgi:predicted lipoprotein with Yx(FWY)xxD motif
MRVTRFAAALALSAAAGFGLIACGGNAPAGAGSTPAAAQSSAAAGSQASSVPQSPAGSGSPAAVGAVLRVAPSALGQIVVDGKGMTVYMFDKDTQNSGSSTCSGQCAAKWPAVSTDSTSPTVQGVTGKIGTIKGADGKNQVTVDGWPVYYFAGDAKAGDTAGQGVGGIWWVIGSDGKKIGAATGSSAAPSATGSAGASDSAPAASSSDGGY